MFFKKMVSLFLLASLMGRIAIADDKKEEFTYVKVGQISPFTGYLFTPEAIAKIYSICTEDLKRAELECTTDIANLNLDIQRTKEEKETEIYIKNKLISDLTKLKNDEIIARENLLAKIEDDKIKNKIYIIGSFVVGVLLTGSVIYFTASLLK